jgi:CubicO group peptidase (beta-lactamase class C family)
MLDALPPDGSVSATATDMASFMGAHLRQGRGLLAPATAALMHQRSFVADPRLDGYAHGFKEKTVNGHRVLMHDGGWEGFRSALILVPECDLGLFASFNGTGGEVAGGELLTAFFDRFAPPPAGARGTGSADTSAPVPGFYKSTRHNQSTVEKVSTLLGPSRLAVDADGTVRFKGKTWTPQGQGLYRVADGDERLVFLTGGDGRRYVATDGVSYQLMPDSETLPVNLAVLLVFAVPALSTLVLPIVALIRRIRRRPASSAGDWRLARGFAAGSAVLGVLFLVLLMATLMGNTDEFLYGVPLSFKALLALPLIVLGGAVAATVYTVRGWRGARILSRIHQITVLAGMVALTWFLWQWNLLGWQYA